MDHATDVDTLDDKFTQILQEFLSMKLVNWMEVVASKLSSERVRKRIKVGSS